ncbi:MAG: sulfur transferase domain-containing protein [Gloeotrichia echinulata IR180]|nr:hypothetical protein [Gloeotrichia echinulata DEX184]
MDMVRKINGDLAIAGQITADQFTQIADDGYRSVLNLRSPDETGFLAHEQEKIECLGLHYVHFPIKAEEINHQIAIQVFQTITELPKPVIIHCDNAIRSAAIMLLYIANKQGIEFEKAFQRTINLGLLEERFGS